MERRILDRGNRVWDGFEGKKIGVVRNLNKVCVVGVLFVNGEEWINNCL